MMKYTITDFHTQFPNDDICLEYIFKKKYSHLKDFNKYYRIKKRKVYCHSETGHQISPTQGTIFHKSSTKLTLWFYAIYLFTQSKNGVSAKELERQLGVTYKCAWRIAKQIRSLMQQGSDLLGDTVEIDETYVGGLEKNKHVCKKVEGAQGRSNKTKTPVVGMVERRGKIKATVTVDTKAKTVRPIIRQNVKIGADIMTDEYSAYKGLHKDGYTHKKINHGAKQYAVGNIHTNTIEGFWSIIKRSISGTHVSVSPKYLQTYVNEFAWKWNLRYSDSHPFLILSGVI